LSISIRTYRKIDELPQLTEAEIQELRPVEDKFAFRVNSYYLNLIEWDDPEDPLRRLIIPSAHELDSDGSLDASSESDYTVAEGLQHKYEDTVLMLVAQTCDSYCRYCFRKRITMRKGEDGALNPDDAISYISQHPAIRNVLLTGGDPLILSAGKLGSIVERTLAIPHVRSIRIGTKVTAFRPQRISEDPELLAMLHRFSPPSRPIYIMNHFSHPRELTSEARDTIQALKETGVVMMNQSPIIRGVNDSPKTLHDLYLELMGLGVMPYYLFLCRPTRGNRMFTVPIVEAYQILQEAFDGLPGLARTARLAMSHQSGKLEITGVDAEHVYLRYHRAADPSTRGRHLTFRRNDRAVWLDELVEESVGGHKRRRPHSRTFGSLTEPDSGPGHFEN
jgi:KamA family protein